MNITLSLLTAGSIKLMFAKKWREQNWGQTNAVQTARENFWTLKLEISSTCRPPCLPGNVCWLPKKYHTVEGILSNFVSTLFWTCYFEFIYNLKKNNSKVWEIQATLQIWWPINLTWLFSVSSKSSQLNFSKCGITPLASLVRELCLEREDMFLIWGGEGG